MRINLNNLEDTKNLAEKISGLIKKGDIIELRGDLGTGKTTFARFFIQKMAGADVEVLSPTFTLVQPYEADNGCIIYHFDLYRLELKEEIYELGVEDAFEEGVSLIEWPQIIADMLPEDRLVISLSCGVDDTRVAEIEAFGSWKGRVKNVES